MKTLAKILFVLLAVFFSQQAFALTPPIEDDPQDENDVRYVNGFWSCAYQCYHLGQDIVVPADTAVHSICSGTVVEVTYNDQPLRQNYGGRVLIECETEEETVTVLYGHLGKNIDGDIEDDIFVALGDLVEENQIIGRIGGSSENGGYGPHLHIGVHHGSYLGTLLECGRWTYAGYTLKRYPKTDACYCNVMDNWIDPMEFLGINPKELQVVRGDVFPKTGIPDLTQFTWNMWANGGRGAPITATVLIYNPVRDREYPFVMRYVNGTGHPFMFDYSGHLQDEGAYEYRFKVETCADKNEEPVRMRGPIARLECGGSETDCNGIDDDCDGETDEGLRRYRSNDCGSGYENCENGQWVGFTVREPEPETCNDRDDDCDRMTDEHLSRECSTACGTGTESCVNGIFSHCTAPQPWGEICNRIDDDCDGETDEGVANACGGCGNVPQEICDFRDNDCDGQTDEDVTNACGGCGYVPRETCDGLDNDCDGQTDEGLLNRCGTCGPVPLEICDRVDNDCNGQVDDGLVIPHTNACVRWHEECINGEWQDVGRRDPVEEICNDLDDDCDRQIDENIARECVTPCGTASIQGCMYGVWGQCRPQGFHPPETCDGLDNDCDGFTDEDVTQMCANSCGNRGTQTCSNGNWGTCSANACRPPAPPPQPPPCSPATEICDNADNDCDGLTDENLSRSCSNGCGNTGTKTCSRGTWSICSASACPPGAPPPEPPACSPATEICDNADNDCDGLTDENLSQSCSNECGNTGVRICSNGNWGSCSANACPPPPPPPPEPEPPPQPPTPPPQPPACSPAPEVCDNADNDCDGFTDENLSQSCSNECGNTGVRICSNGNWGSCSANACPPPPPPPPEPEPPPQPPPPQEPPAPPPVTEAPVISGPADNHIREVSFSSSASNTVLDWETTPNAVRYEYEIRYGGIYESGSLIAQGTTDHTYFNFTASRSQYGIAIQWKVRGLNPNGQEGPWSRTRALYFSYPIGSAVKCASASCPSRDAWYQISRDIDVSGDVGIPNMLIADYINTACASGRTATSLPFEEMSGYKRSARFNGCPPR